MFKILKDFGFTDFISKRGDEIDGTIRNHTSEKNGKKSNGSQSTTQELGRLCNTNHLK